MLHIWQKIREELNRSKIYILVAVILFAFGIYSGYSSNELDELLIQTTNEVFGQISKEISESDNPTQTSIILIFFNNVRAVLVMMVLGILLGFFPAFSMLFNGILMGFVLRIQAAAGFPVGDLVMRGILPHGILELPAIFIAAGYGMRIGFNIILRLFPSMRPRTQAIGDSVKAGIPLFGFLVVVLLLASIIESTITPWLLGQ